MDAASAAHTSEYPPAMPWSNPGKGNTSNTRRIFFQGLRVLRPGLGQGPGKENNLGTQGVTGQGNRVRDAQSQRLCQHCGE